MVGLLVDLLPPGSQLALATRAEPPWRLARLRAAGRLTEIDASALEMTPSEGTALLRAAGITLDRQESEAVVREQWDWTDENGKRDEQYYVDAVPGASADFPDKSDDDTGASRGKYRG